MIHFTTRIIWMGCALMLFQNDYACGSGGSIISAGALSKLSGGETGFRQMVKLKVNGDIVSAIPQNSPIRLITMHAPDLKNGHMIIRELELSEGQKSILISVPKNIYSNIRRTTIYLSPASNDVLFYQQHGNGWERLEPIKLIASSHFSNQAGLEEMWAYSVASLGHFRLSHHMITHPDSIQITVDHKAGLIPMGSVHRGVFPWICAGILLLIIGTLSYIIHKMECKGAN